VIISSDEVATPVAVRYGWGNNPDDLNLYNSVDLPANPFRTDTWEGITK
jgi:sialate O-acetylesterase